MRRAILKAIAKTNAVAMTTVAKMTVMVMTMLSGTCSEAELCCTEI